MTDHCSDSPLSQTHIHTTVTRKSGIKRGSPSQQVDDSPIMIKRYKTTPLSERITRDVDYESRSLIGDMTRSCTLPTIPGKHRDMKTITSQTVSVEIRGAIISTHCICRVNLNIDYLLSCC
jgi:hypothetical protein